MLKELSFVVSINIAGLEVLACGVNTNLTMGLLLPNHVLP